MERSHALSVSLAETRTSRNPPAGPGGSVPVVCRPVPLARPVLHFAGPLASSATAQDVVEAPSFLELLSNVV